MRNNTPLTLIIPLLAACLLLIGRPATAQSDQELRQENQRLRTENEDLKRDLEAARQAIERLEKQLQALEMIISRMGGNSGTGGTGSGSGSNTPPPPQVSIDESEPQASPRALLKAIEESHKESMSDVPMGEAGSRERTAYNRALERWISSVNRQMRFPIEWIVTLERGQRVRGGYELMVQAIDPVHDTELGDPFVISISDAQARRMGAISVGDRLSLKGTLNANARLNADRETSGPFNNPPLIGPFVEFGYTVDMNSLVPAPKEKVEEKKDESTNGTGGGSTGAGAK